MSVSIKINPRYCHSLFFLLYSAQFTYLLILNFFVMRNKKETLIRIIQLMDMENLSQSDVEKYRKNHYRNIARRWLQTQHQPGWFINSEGASAETLAELDIVDPEFEPFGIWLNDNIIISSRIMYEPGDYDEAEKFILGTTLGPFYFRLPSADEQSLLPGKLSVVSEALACIGFSEIPAAHFWTSEKIKLDEQLHIAVNGVEESSFAYSAPGEKHLGLYIINIG